jgi:hypothetical protein
MGTQKMRLTIETRFWQVPSRTNAFQGVIEGRPTDDKRQQVYEKVDRERAEWKPSNEAWHQLHLLQDFVGEPVSIQFWNPIMFMLEDEGPFPLNADCRGIAIVQEDGFLQAYLMLDNVSEVRTPDGCGSLGYLKEIPGIAMACAPVADLYEINSTERKVINIGNDAPSMYALEELGRKPLSTHFFMRDFLYSESASLARIVNYPDDPKTALKNGRKLCELLLEPLQDTFGRIEIRSAYRCSAVNDFCNKKKNWGCASNARNSGRHIWDVAGEDVGHGAMACIVIPTIADLYKQDESVWKQLAWYIHDRLPYSELEFFKRLCAFNIGWATKPLKRITRATGSPRLLTEPGMADHDGDHSDRYATLVRTRNLK